MHKLAEICVRRPVFAAVLVLVLLVTGVFGYQKLGVDWFPKIDFPVVIVTGVLPGAAPEEMEIEVADKLEQAVNTVSGIEELHSVSSEGLARVAIMFELEKNVDIAAQEVRDRINTVLPDLPQEMRLPTVEKSDPDAAPVLTVALTGDAAIGDLTEYADKVLKRQLESTPGVGQIMLQGGQARQINISLDPTKLRAHHLTVNDVARAIQAKNIEVPGGTVQAGPQEYTLRTLGKVESMDELRRLVVVDLNGFMVRLSDLGEVEDGFKEAESLAQFNDTPAVLLEIRKQSGSNTIQVVDSIRARLDELMKTVPKGYKIEVVRDLSRFVRDAIHTVKEHLILGAFLAALVVMLFLSNLRTTIISALAIPTSIISTFAVVYYFGFTLNIMTLLALTLSVGIVIDDAIVVLENTYRFIEEKGMTPHDAALAATREIGLAVMAITLSLLAVFLPIAFMQGIVGRVLQCFGITMASAIVVSLLVSFSLTPMLASRWLRPSQTPGEDTSKKHLASKDQRFYRIIEHAYLAMLGFSLRHRWVVVLLIVALLGTIPLQLKLVQKNFLPEEDQSQFQIEVRAPEGTSLEQTRVIMARIAREIRQLNGVQYTLLNVSDSMRRQANRGIMYVRLLTPTERQFRQLQIMDFVRREVLPHYASEKLRLNVSQVEEIGAGPSSALIQYVIGGPDFKKLEACAEIIKTKLHEMPGVVDIDSNIMGGKPQYGVRVDRDRAEDLGVPVVEIARTLRLLVAGEKVSTFNERGEEYDINVRAAAQFRNDIDELRRATVATLTRGPVPLGDVVRISEGTGPAQINRLNRARQVTVYANLTPGTSQQEVLDVIKQTIQEQNLGPSYFSTPMGQSKELGKTMTAFGTAFLMAFIFMFLVLAAQFESWLHPITIMMSLPITLPFALVSLFLFHQSLNVLSLLGLLVLFAVVKKNAILQIDHTNQLRADGLERYEAIITANRHRLRPILMTTVAFIAGMVPLLISKDTGASMNRTISSVVIGGQSLSLLITLIAIPVAYTFFDDITQFLSRISRRIRGGSVEK